MPGDEWQPKIDTYLDGEPPTEEMRELDAHVRSCRSCAAEVLNRLQRIVGTDCRPTEQELAQIAAEAA